MDRISPEKDVARVTAYIPRSLASAIPEPVLYQHGLVGECKDLIFGFSLAGYATSKNLPDGDIPKIVKMCVAEIDSRGSEAEGIYRVSFQILLGMLIKIFSGFWSTCCCPIGA